MKLHSAFCTDDKMMNLQSSIFNLQSKSIEGSTGRWHNDSAILAGMAISLAIFYRGSFQLPITVLGLALFVALAFVRPRLALLFVPLTVPLYLMPKGVWDERFGIRPEGLRVPMHEVVLLTTLVATLPRLAYSLWRSRLQPVPHTLRAEWPLLLAAALVLAGGTLGVLIALPEGRSEALRQWRWLIVEPALFAALAAYWLYQKRGLSNVALTWSFVVAGSAAALIGILQYFGHDLVPLIGQRVAHSESVVVIDGVRRVTSVYGHPNNLALFLGRVWPLAAGLALACWFRNKGWGTWLALGAGLLALVGLLAAASRGANLGALAAAGLLGGGLLLSLRGRTARYTVIVVAVGLAVLLLLSLRSDDLGTGSAGVRLLLWSAATRMLSDHPLGVGLGQFYFYHNPEFGHGYIAPQLVGTSEQYAAHPHNLPLDVYLQLGPLGTLGMAWLLASIFWRSIGMLRDAQAPVGARALQLGLIAALAAALTHGLVDTFYFVPDLAYFFWFSIVMMLKPLLHARTT